MTDTTTDTDDATTTAELGGSQGQDVHDTDATVDRDTDTRDTRDTDEGSDDTRDGGKEAAKWRRKLRDTEAERDALADRLGALQKQVVESTVTAAGVKPAGFWASGATLEDLLDESGGVDAAKLDQAINAAVGTLGLKRQPRAPKPDPNARRVTNHHGEVSGWREALRPGRD